MILLQEARLHKFKGADGKKLKKYRNMCHQAARATYYKLKKRGKDVKYMEGEVYVGMPDITGKKEWKWIEHAWNLVNGKILDVALGQNDYKYRGYIVKDEYMEKIPEWMKSYTDPSDKCSINIRVGDEYGKKVYESYERKMTLQEEVMKMGFKGREIGKQIEKMETEKYLNENKVKGGLADGKSPEEIAEKHGVSVDHIKKQLKMGIEVEMEHTDDKKVSAEIALDHLYEHPDYYTRLKKVEEINKRIDEISSNNARYNADAGEPDSGYLTDGDVRELGTNKGRPEYWFDNGGYTQLHFPAGDFVFGRDEEADDVSQKRKVTYKVDNVKKSTADSPKDEREREVVQEAIPTKKIDKTEFPNPTKQKGFLTKGKRDGSKTDDMVASRKVSIPVSKLNPSQDAIYLAKALGMATNGITGGWLGAVISDDDYILDGHHRYAATFLNDPSATVGGLKVNLVIGDLIPVLRSVGDAFKNPRGTKPSGGDINIFDATIDDIKECIFQGKYMDRRFYDKRRAIQWFDSIGEKELQRRLKKIQSKTPPLGAPRRKDMPRIGADQLTILKRLLQKGKIDVDEPYAKESVNEASYAGNLGFEEMMKFYDTATNSQISKLERLIDRGKNSQAWKLVQGVTGMKLKGKEFEQFVLEYPFMDGRHRHGVDDWGSLRDDDEMDINEIAGMGYAGKEDIEKMEKEFKRLRKKFDKEESEREYGSSYANSHLSEATIANTLGSGNNSARWTAPGQKRKMNIPSLAGYSQVIFPEADDLDISNEEFGWEAVSKSKKYNNKRVAVRNEQGELVFEGRVKDLKRILKEGGAYGHMNHPFDTDINLTFGQLKDIVDRALEGKLEMTTEKLDGQALAISWKNGRLIAARNKGHLKNRGETALDINGVASKFQGRGEIEKAYNYAMRDLSKAIEKLTDAQREKIFKNGACFMNLEVIYPPSSNVIPYGAPFLVFHGTMEYDKDGNAVGENKGAARILAGMIKQVEEEVQDTYTISGPPVVELPEEQDLSQKKSKYKKQIRDLQSEFNLRDNDGVAEYHQAWWKEWVEQNAPKALSNKVLMGIVGRWAFEDRSFRLNGKTVEDDEVLAWAKKHDKSKLIKSTRKENLMKFENIFLGLGAEVLKFTQSALVVSPDRAKRKIKDDIEKTIKDVRKKGDEKQIKKLELELKRLNAVGGVESVVPIEGVVFQYKAKDTVYTLKLTGSFASANQLLGIFFGQ